MLKREMIEHIENQYFKFLGHKSLYCNTSFTKARYQKMIQNMDKAIYWKQVLDRINKAIDKEYGENSWFLAGDSRLNWLREKSDYAYRKAHEYWWNHSKK